MAQSEPVEVVVEAIDEFSEDLGKLTAELEKIDGKTLNVDLEIADGGDFERVEALLDKLEEDINTDLHIGMVGEQAVRATKRDLARDVTSKVRFKTENADKLQDFKATGGDRPNGPPSDDPIVPAPKDRDLGIEIDNLSDIKADLSSLEDNLSTTLKIDVDGYQAALGKKMNLARDTTATVRLKTVGDGRAGLIGDHVDAKKAANEIINDNVAAAMGKSPSHRDRVPAKFGLDQEFGRGTRDTSPKELDLGIDIPDFDEIQTKLNALGDDIDSTLNIKVSGFRSALGKKQSLARDMTATIHLQTRGKSRAAQAIKGTMPDGDAMPRIGVGASPSSKDSDGFSMVNPIPRDVLRSNRGGSIPKIKGPISKIDAFPNLGSGLRSSSRDSDLLSDSLKTLAPSAVRSAGAMSEFGGSLTKVRPRMSSVYTAALILAPVIVALAGAAVGAAAALAGIATAGAAIVGLGLIGYGDTAAESMKMLQSKIGGVKRDIFKTLKPAMETMNPVVDKWLDGVAPAIQDLVGPLSRLVDYEGFLAGVGSGAVDMIRRFLETVNELRPRIESIGRLLADAFGGFNIMEWGIDEIFENAKQFRQLGNILISLVVIIYNVAKALAFMVAPFAPLIAMVASLSSVLNNDLVRGFLLMVAAISAVNIAVWALNGAIGVLAGSVLGTIAASIIAVIGMLYNMLAAVWANVGAWYALAGAIAATGIGAALVIGGGVVAGELAGRAGGNANSVGGSAGGGMSAGTGGATFNVYGGMDDSTYQRVRDDFGSMHDGAGQRDDAMSK